MNRKELVESIQSKADLDIPKNHVEAVLDALSAVTHIALSGEDDVMLPGIGKFAITVRKPRTGRNPKTGETLEIPGKRVPRFTPAKKLKDACNGEATPSAVAKR